MYVIYSPAGLCFRGYSPGLYGWYWQYELSKIGLPFESKFAAECKCLEDQAVVSLDEARLIEQLRDL